MLHLSREASPEVGIVAVPASDDKPCNDSLATTVVGKASKEVEHGIAKKID